MKDAIRSKVRMRAKDCCEYCLAQARFSHDSFAVEHIIPKSKNGTDELDNLAWSCQGCNNFKYTATEAIDLVTARMVPLYHPRKDIWSDHFRWNRDFSQIIGISPVGRATVERLQLNRPGLMNLRTVLRSVDKHPPQ